MYIVSRLAFIFIYIYIYIIAHVRFTWQVRLGHICRLGVVCLCDRGGVGHRAYERERDWDISRGASEVWDIERISYIYNI
jgi:hypothetical protein